MGMHGYPLYAAIHFTAGSFDETIFSDPFMATMKLSWSRIPNIPSRPPAAPGYEELVEAVTPSGAAYTHDIPLLVDAEACAAPVTADYDIFYSFECSDEGFHPAAQPALPGATSRRPREGHSGD
jgi:hypothetical protein